jgi:hypothetical protein
LNPGKDRIERWVGILALGLIGLFFLAVNTFPIVTNDSLSYLDHARDLVGDGLLLSQLRSCSNLTNPSKKPPAGQVPSVSLTDANGHNQCLDRSRAHHGLSDSVVRLLRRHLLFTRRAGQVFAQAGGYEALAQSSKPLHWVPHRTPPALRTRSSGGVPETVTRSVGEPLAFVEVSILNKASPFALYT